MKSNEMKAQELLEAFLWPEKMGVLVGPIMEQLKPLLKEDDRPKLKTIRPAIVKWITQSPDPDCKRCGGRGFYMVPDGPDDICKEPCDCMYIEEE